MCCRMMNFFFYIEDIIWFLDLQSLYELCVQNFHAYQIDVHVTFHKLFEKEKKSSTNTLRDNNSSKRIVSKHEQQEKKISKVKNKESNKTSVEKENIIIEFKPQCENSQKGNKPIQKDNDLPNSAFDLFQNRLLKIKQQVFIYHVRGTYSHPASIRGTPWSLFSTDIYRLASFANYPSNAVKSPFMLASEGFVYIGNGLGDKVMCFYCGKEKENWRLEDVVEDVHRLMSPNCPKVVSRLQNAERPTLTGASNYNSIETEINTRTSGVSPALISYDQVDSIVDTTNVTLNTESHNDVNHEGNNENVSRLQIQTPVRHMVQNETLSSSLSTLTLTNINGSVSHTDTVASDVRHNENIVHTNQSQVSVNQTETTNSAVDLTRNNEVISTEPTYSDLGIITDRPKRPEYALKIKRMESFSSWPRYHHLSPDELAEAGFYFAGYGDCTRCFFCGGGLRNWEDEDDVWVEHARWFPRCSYLKQKLGEDFVEIVQDLHLQHEQITLADVQIRLENHSRFLDNDTRESLIKHDPAVQALTCLGFNPTDIIQIASVLKQEDNVIAADSLFDKLIAEGKMRTQNLIVPYGIENVEIDLQGFRLLKERNNQIRQQMMCKICLDNDVSVVFLPCGHLVSCADCASAMRNCPVCRSNVRGITRVLIS